jgi:hypothetical protein
MKPRAPIGKNPFANPVLPDGRVVRPGERLRRRIVSATPTIKGLATVKPVPPDEAWLLAARTVAKMRARRAQLDLAAEMVEQVRLLRLGREIAEILAAPPAPEPPLVTANDEVRAERLADVFRAAEVTERQGHAWLLDRLGMSQPEIGRVLGGVRRSNVSELVTKAAAKLRAHRPGGGRVTGLAIADRIIAEERQARADRGPYGAVTRARAHGSGTGRARSVKYVPQGDDAGLQDAVRRARMTRKGGGRRSVRDDG